MNEKRFTLDDEKNGLCRCILVDGEETPTCEICDLLNKLYEENEQLQQELRGMDKLLKSYRETIKHDAELLADATRNGYLPPLDDFVKG